MQIRTIDGYVASCEAKGVHRDVNLFMMQDEALAVDDFVVVHVGYAIQKITPQEAQTASGALRPDACRRLTFHARTRHMPGTDVTGRNDCQR